MPRRTDPARRRRSRIPLWFPAAMAPVIAANAALIYFAVASAPGLVTEHPFETGRQYDRDIAGAALQRAQGWSAALAVPARAGRMDEAVLTVRDGRGMPVTGLAVVLRVWRPVESAPDLRANLAEAAPGRYVARVRLPRPGQWQFDLLARRGAEEYAIGRRVVVK